MKELHALLGEWLAKLFPQPAATQKGTPMTTTTTAAAAATVTLDASQLKLETTVQDIASAMGTVGGDAGALWKDVVLAAKSKFGDGWQDLITVNDLVVLAAQLVADVGDFVPNPVSTAAAEVLTVDKLVTSVLPQALAVYQFVQAVAKLAPGLKFQGADPTASAEDGGFPEGATGGRTGRR